MRRHAGTQVCHQRALYVPSRSVALRNSLGGRKAIVTTPPAPTPAHLPFTESHLEPVRICHARRRSSVEAVNARDERPALLLRARNTEYIRRQQQWSPPPHLEKHSSPPSSRGASFFLEWVTNCVRSGRLFPLQCLSTGSVRGVYGCVLAVCTLREGGYFWVRCMYTGTPRTELSVHGCGIAGT